MEAIVTACQFSLLGVDVRAMLDVIFHRKTFCASVLLPAPLVRSSCDVGSSLHSFLTSRLLLYGLTGKPRDSPLLRSFNSS